MNRKWMLLFLVCIILFSLSACRKSVVDEAAIKNDIQLVDTFFEKNSSLEIDSLNINRETNHKEKRDYLFVSYAASNDSMTYTAEADMVYSLYNKEWALQDFQILFSDWLPKKECDKAEVEQKLRNSGCTSLELVSEKKVTDKDYSFVYRVRKPESEYFDSEMEKTVACSFSEKGTWKIEVDGSEMLRILPSENILGLWSYKREWNVLHGRRSDDVKIDFKEIRDDTIIAELNINNILYTNDYASTYIAKDPSIRFSGTKEIKIPDNLYYSVPLELNNGQVIRLEFSTVSEPLEISYKVLLFNDGSYELTKE